MKMAGARQGQPEKVLELAGANEDGGAGGEADHHRMGDEVDQGAEAGESHDQLEQAHHHGHGQGQLHILRDCPVLHGC